MLQLIGGRASAALAMVALSTLGGSRTARAVEPHAVLAAGDDETGAASPPRFFMLAPRQGAYDEAGAAAAAEGRAQGRWSDERARTAARAVRLEKSAPTTDASYAAAFLLGLEGTPVGALRRMGYSLYGRCGAGTPRFNLFYDNDEDGRADGVALYGCHVHLVGETRERAANGGARDGWKRVEVDPLRDLSGCRSFAAEAETGERAPCGLGPTSRVVSLSVLADEQGVYFIDDVFAAGFATGEPGGLDGLGALFSSLWRQLGLPNRGAPPRLPAPRPPGHVTRGGIAMATITFKGSPIHTSGELPKVGQKAPDFRLTRGTLEDARLGDFAGKKKVLNIVPSLDTGVCAMSAKRFEKESGALGDTVILTVSRDLPFAQKRFCSAEGIEHVIPLSELRDREFGKSYGVEMADGPLAGLLSRAVVVLDAQDKVLYAEQVPEIAQEPNYTAALEALRKT